MSLRSTRRQWPPSGNSTVLIHVNGRHPVAQITGYGGGRRTLGPRPCGLWNAVLRMWSHNACAVPQCMHVMHACIKQAVAHVTNTFDPPSKNFVKEMVSHLQSPPPSHGTKASPHDLDGPAAQRTLQTG